MLFEIALTRFLQPVLSALISCFLISKGFCGSPPPKSIVTSFCFPLIRLIKGTIPYAQLNSRSFPLTCLYEF